MEYVDLGLSVLWADRNIGALDINECGNYYSFDELPIDGYTLPTKEQFEELIDKCNWEWNSVFKGYIITGPNGNNIFLPAAGYADRLSYSLYGTDGLYLSSTPAGEHIYCLWFSERCRFVGDVKDECMRSARAVKSKDSNTGLKGLFIPPNKDVTSITYHEDKIVIGLKAKFPEVIVVYNLHEKLIGHAVNAAKDGKIEFSDCVIYSSFTENLSYQDGGYITPVTHWEEASLEEQKTYEQYKEAYNKLRYELC